MSKVEELAAWMGRAIDETVEDGGWRMRCNAPLMKKFYGTLSRQQATIPALESGRLLSLPLNIMARATPSLRLWPLLAACGTPSFIRLGPLPSQSFRDGLRPRQRLQPTTFLRFKVFGTKYLFVSPFWVIPRV